MKRMEMNFFFASYIFFYLYNNKKKELNKKTIDRFIYLFMFYKAKINQSEGQVSNLNFHHLIYEKDTFKCYKRYVYIVVVVVVHTYNS